MRRALSTLAVLSSLLIASDAHAAEFKFSTQTLTVPDDFEIEVAADSSIVPRPIAGSFDEQGRLYVTDSSGQSDKAEKQLASKSHRVLRLEDSKGDGHFDKSTVFAAGMMFPEGCLWSDGSLYVSAVPQIWKLTGAASGEAAQREVWFDGKTMTGCANDLHGPFSGPDGWMYWCKGAFSQQTYERPGRAPFVTRASHIFRARPDGSGIEPVLTGGMDNPVGVAFTSTGERFLTATFLQQPAMGRRDGVIHAIYGGVYGKVNDVIDEHPQTGGLLPPLIHLGAAAPCGIAAYQSRVFGPEFHDNLFVCCFNLHKVTRHILIPDGATYRTTDSDFVSSDSPDFHPTCVIEDADGSLLIIDTGGWYKMCCPTSQLSKPDVLGAIYRVRKKGAPKIADPRGLSLPWASMTPAQLAALLADARVTVRERATRELGKKGDEAVRELRGLIDSYFDPEARLAAVWALTRIDAPAARSIVHKCLTDKSEEVRHAAIHSISVWRDAKYAEVALLMTLRDHSQQLRRVAAEALGRIGSKNAVPGLIAAAAEAQDRVGEHSAIYALIEIADAEGVRSALSSDNPRAKRAALIALDQMEGHPLKPEDATPLLTSADPLLKETAVWITGHRPEWGDSLAGFYRERLHSAELDEKTAAELSAQLAPLARAPAIQELLADTLRDSPSPQARRAALDAMAAAALKETPARWFAELSKALSSSDPAAVGHAIAALRALTMPKQPPVDVTAALTAIGVSPTLPDALRLDALAALPAGLSDVPSELLPFLTSHLAAAQPLPVRSAAASVLAKARLTPVQLTELLAALPGTGPLEMPKLLTAFERAPGEALGMQLIPALNQAPPGLRADQVKTLLAKFPASVQQAGIPLLAKLNADSARQSAHLDELTASLTTGDVRRGQSVFLKTGCTVCHSMGYLGGKLGPDLTRIGGIRTERDLLEAIVYPSASFVRSYEPMIATTRTGDQFTGILRKDAPDEIVLAIGPELEQRLPRADLRDLQPGTVSLMPQGFEQALSRQDLADLISFLKAAK